MRCNFFLTEIRNVDVPRCHPGCCTFAWPLGLVSQCGVWAPVRPHEHTREHRLEFRNRTIVVVLQPVAVSGDVLTCSIGSRIFDQQQVYEL